MVQSWISIRSAYINDHLWFRNLVQGHIMHTTFSHIFYLKYEPDILSNFKRSGRGGLYIRSEHRLILQRSDRDLWSRNLVQGHCNRLLKATLSVKYEPDWTKGGKTMYMDGPDLQTSAWSYNLKYGNLIVSRLLHTQARSCLYTIMQVRTHHPPPPKKKKKWGEREIIWRKNIQHNLFQIILYL